MKHRNLGSLTVSEIGLGCMGMSAFYGTADEAEAIATTRRPLELGCNFLDTAQTYGPFKNEELVGKALAPRREEVVIATKFAWRYEQAEDGSWTRTPDGSPANAREGLEGSLRRLGTDYVDLYYLHRLDPNIPIEETVGGMAELVQEGKVRHIGLSEVAPETLRRGHATHPITALQSEYSLWTRDVEEEILPACRELGVGFVAYSPLGRGFLTGQFNSPEDLPEGDRRRIFPRFQEENFRRNMELVERVRALAARKGCT